MSSKGMRLLAACVEAAGSVGYGPLVADLCGPLGCCRLVTPATTVAHASLLHWAARSPVVPWASGPSQNRCQGAGRRLADSNEQSTSDGQTELESSSAFLLLTWCCRELPPTPLGRLRAEALAELAFVVARAFLPAATAFLISRRNTGESSMLLIALI
jgi:hypothetical protein